MLATRERFKNLCQRIDAKDHPFARRTIDGTYDELFAAYNGPDRHYHTLDHISCGLETLGEIRHIVRDPDSIEAAWWGHDFIFIPGSPFNEEESALWWIKILYELGVKTPFRVKVMNRIMATRHDHVPWYFEDQIIVDIDLAGLALPAEQFDENTAKNREEYRILVPDDRDFEKGKAQFFRKFLEDRPSIYLTNYFKKKYEARAQENVKGLIAKAGI